MLLQKSFEELTYLVSVPGIVSVDDGWRGRPEGPVDLLVELAHLPDRPHPQVEEHIFEKGLLLVIKLKILRSFKLNLPLFS